MVSMGDSEQPVGLLIRTKRHQDSTHPLLVVDNDHDGHSNIDHQNEKEIHASGSVQTTALISTTP